MSVRLIDAAFGDACSVFPLPPAGDPEERWLRGVALGGLGRYASAAAELERVAVDRAAPQRLRSLALSTAASHLRQCGLHSVALGWDGRALAAADSGDAVADALIGLAADNLGRGDFAASARLLARATEVVSAMSDTVGPWVASGRLMLRLQWVSAELALYAGHADRAPAIVAQMDTGAPSRRHRLKSSLIAAATAAATGDTVGATETAVTVFNGTREHAQRPLQWASAMMLHSLDPVGSWGASVQELSTWMYVPGAGLRLTGGVGR